MRSIVFIALEPLVQLHLISNHSIIVAKSNVAKMVYKRQNNSHRQAVEYFNLFPSLCTISVALIPAHIVPSCVRVNSIVESVQVQLSRSSPQ